MLHRLANAANKRATDLWPVKLSLGRLLPHIQRALELSWELAHERGARHVLLDVLDHLPRPNRTAKVPMRDQHDRRVGPPDLSRRML